MFKFKLIIYIYIKNLQKIIIFKMANWQETVSLYIFKIWNTNKNLFFKAQLYEQIIQKPKMTDKLL
jgi:hypothetical protein